MINSTVTTQKVNTLRDLQNRGGSGEEALSASDGQKSAQAPGRAAFGAGEAYVSNSPYETVPQMHSQPTEDTVMIGGTEKKRSTVKKCVIDECRNRSGRRYPFGHIWRSRNFEG